MKTQRITADDLCEMLDRINHLRQRAQKTSQEEILTALTEASRPVWRAIQETAAHEVQLAWKNRVEAQGGYDPRTTSAPPNPKGTER